MTSFSFLAEDDLYGSAAAEPAAVPSKGSDAKTPKFAPAKQEAGAPVPPPAAPPPSSVSRKDLEVLASYVEFLERRLSSLERTQAAAQIPPPQPPLTPWMLVLLLSIALVVVWLRRTPQPLVSQLPGPYYMPFAAAGPVQAPGTPGLAMPPVTFLPR